MAAVYASVQKPINLECLLEKVINKFKVKWVDFIVYPASNRIAPENEKFDPEYEISVGQERIIFHQETRYLPLEEGSIVKYIDELINELDFKEGGREEDENIGLLSEVLAEGAQKHIPMIDFKCPVCPENEKQVVKFLLEILGEKIGVLLNSGHSYHYYGLGNLYSKNQWVMFNNLLAKSSLVGEVWPIIQIKSGFSVLRWSTSKNKPDMPRIIGTIGKIFNL